MSFFETKKTFEIELTYKCNWNCKYCAVKTHTKKSFTNEQVLENFRLKTNNFRDTIQSTVILSGGEPTSVGKNVLDVYIKLSKQYNFDLKINTNGMLFKEESIIKEFKQINWHVSDELIMTNHIQTILKSLPKNVLPLIVVSDSNFKNLQSFMKQWPKDIKILLIPASDPEGKINYFDEDKYQYLHVYKKQVTKDSWLLILTKNQLYKEREKSITYIENYKKD